MATECPKFSQLPVEIRPKIILMAVNEAVDEDGLPQGTRIIHLNLNAVGSLMLRRGGLLSQPPVFLVNHEFRSEALKQLTLLEGKLVNFH
jgi:hypothetical protein